jgi:hypothetical protein
MGQMGNITARIRIRNSVEAGFDIEPTVTGAIKYKPALTAANNIRPL